MAFRESAAMIQLRELCDVSSVLYLQMGAALVAAFMFPGCVPTARRAYFRWQSLMSPA